MRSSAAARDRSLLWLVLVSAALYALSMHVGIYAVLLKESGPAVSALRSSSFWAVSFVYAASVVVGAWRRDAWLRNALVVAPAGLALGLAVAYATLGRVWDLPQDVVLNDITLAAMPVVIVAPLTIMIVGAFRALYAPQDSLSNTP